MVQKSTLNKYDFFCFFLVGLLCTGEIGFLGGLTVERIFCLLFFPVLLNSWRRNNIPIKHIVAFIIFFTFYSLFSFLWTPDIEEGLKTFIYNSIHFSIFLEIIVFSSLSKKPLKNLSWGWLVAVLCCSVISIWEISTGNHLSMNYDYAEGGDRAVGDAIVQHLITSVTFGNYNCYVVFLCYCIPWLFYTYIEEKDSVVSKFLSLLGLILSSLFIFYNASRGGLLCVGVFGALYFLMTPKTLKKSIIAGILVVLLTYVIINYGEDAMTIIKARAEGGGLTHDSVRSELWEDSFKVFNESFGLGVGIGGIIASVKMNPHNLFVELLVEYGVIIFILVVCFLLKIFLLSCRCKNRNIKLVLLMCILTFPIHSVINSSYLLSPQLYVFIATIYVFANYKRLHVDGV